MDGENFARIAKLDSKATNGTSFSSLNYTISVDNTGAVVSLGATLVAIFSLFSFRSNRKWVLTMLIATGIFIACQKGDPAGVNSDDNNIKNVRIVQVDKDGSVKFSRVVSVVSE
ncbi:hypothetical protein U0035_13200 [Niabella yanshanensis]|uniref:Uncharacterized protein n=1 Tax=Niabella yanshanensis TaxID=577386 RepID=A0ABZ0W125_9BACT|nr:hypothetical protein [Niabella yanshanensis]WQD36624.1 hypothetical protein U0035_13200 [Niabella yanshanensis]